MTTSEAATLSSYAKGGEVVVQVQGMSRFFDPGYVRALWNVSFEVYQGEIFGLVGPGGCGKSTVARILAGCLTPSEGKARIFGRSPRRRAVKNRISFLPQKPSDAHSQFLAQTMGFFSELIVGARHEPGSEGVSFKVNGRERIAAMKKVLWQNTRLVLLDDPFYALEAECRGEMMELIRTVAEQGRTVVVFCRSLLEANSVCHRLAVLHRGELQALGTLQQLLATRENLSFMVDLLPDETASIFLDVIRRAAGLPALSSGSPLEYQKESVQPVKEVEIPGTPQPTESAADKLLTPLLKAVAPSENHAAETTPSVDHELLAALSKPSDQKPPPQRKA